MTTVKYWRDCHTFQDLLQKNSSWIIDVIADRSKYDDDEISTQRPYPHIDDALLNDLRFLTKKVFIGNSFPSQKNEFKCTYKQREYVEGVMEHNRAINMYNALKDDKDIMIVLVQCHSSGSSDVMAKNFDEKIPLRLVPFDQSGIMVDAIKDKIKFEIMSEMLIGVKVVKQLGSSYYETIRQSTSKDTEKLKEFKTKILGNGDQNQRRRELYPVIEEMGVTSLTSFIPTAETESLGPGFTNSLYARYNNIQNVLSVTVMDRLWGRAGYLIQRIRSVL
jgi:hypothetical protein